MNSWLRLPGPSTQIQDPPHKCHSCGFKDLYQQPDFNRSVGVWLVGLASLATCVLFYFDAGWWWTWSPMALVLLLDRGVFMYTTPLAILCYKCGHIHRGLKSKDANEYASFDLELYDRIHYQDRNS